MALYESLGMRWEYYPGEKENGGPRSGYHQGALQGRRPLRILGFYGGAACGGCDGISTQLAVEMMVRKAVEDQVDLVFEGLLISHLASRWVVLPRALGVPWRFLFLDTSEEACVQRAIDRRIAKGNHKPFNPKNTVQKYKDISRRYDQMKAMGLDCLKASSDDAPRRIYEFFEGRPFPMVSVHGLHSGAGAAAPPEGSRPAPVDGGPDPRQISFL
jgi:hypothetical protein